MLGHNESENPIGIETTGYQPTPGPLRARHNESENPIGIETDLICMMGHTPSSHNESENPIGIETRRKWPSSDSRSCHNESENPIGIETGGCRPGRLPRCVTTNQKTR